MLLPLRRVPRAALVVLLVLCGVIIPLFLLRLVHSADDGAVKGTLGIRSAPPGTPANQFPGSVKYYIHTCAVYLVILEPPSLQHSAGRPGNEEHPPPPPPLLPHPLFQNPRSATAKGTLEASKSTVSFGM